MNTFQDTIPILLPFADLVVKIALVVAGAAIAAFAARRAAAATRHLIWVSAVVAALLLPAATALIPDGMGPHWTVPSSATVEPVDVAPLPVASGVMPRPLGVAKSGHPGNSPLGVVIKIAAPQPAGMGRIGILLLLAGGVYVCGLIFVGARIGGGFAGIRRLSRESRVVDSSDTLGHSLNECAKIIGVRNPPRLLVHADAVPMTWGWRKPVILLPEDALTWDAERLRVVLLHELSHIGRRDWPVQMFAQAVCALYWFHPPIWWALSQVRAESERACDDRVLLSGVAADSYARHLLDIARLSGQKMHGQSGTRLATPMARPAGLEPRLRAILSQHAVRLWEHRRREIAGMLLVSGLLLALLTTLRPEVRGRASRATDRLAPSPAALAPAPDDLRHIATPAEIRAAKPFHYVNVSSTISAPAGMIKPLSYDTVPVNPRWVRAIANGVTVELVGTSVRRDVNGKPTLDGQSEIGPVSLFWTSWTPDGVTYPTPLYTSRLDPLSRSYPSKPTRTVEVAFRIKGALGKAITLNPDIHPNLGTAMHGPSWDHSSVQGDYHTDWTTGGFRILDVVFPLNQKSTSFRLGVACDDWKTVAATNLAGVQNGVSPGLFNSVTTVVDGKKAEIAFSGLMHDKDYASHSRFCLTVTDSALTSNPRIVAVDKDGKIVQPIGESSSVVSVFRQTTVWFNETELPIARVKEIRFETRPFHWVEFKDVALYPNP